MGMTSIEWTDRTWNPVTGCSHVSAGCRNCYAEKIAERFRGTKAFPDGFDVTLHPDRLRDPLKWRKPGRIFVNSMSDLFHESVPFDFIDQVFLTMATALDHTFQVLTKRAARMVEYFETSKHRTASHDWSRITPLPNVHLGVSVENQMAAYARIPLLLQIPAAVRFLSCEPLIGRVDLCEYLGMWWNQSMKCFESTGPMFNRGGIEGLSRPGIGWVIAGGESGPGARPMFPDWGRSLRDQCQAAGVPFFFKQWGEWAPYNGGRDSWKELSKLENPKCMDTPLRRDGKKQAGRLLDGREWSEFPNPAPAVSGIKGG